MSTTLPPTIAQHFDGRGKDVRATYDRILAIAREWGDVKPEAKKAAIQLLRVAVPFATIAPRKDVLVLTFKSTSDIRSARITKHDQGAGGNWTLEVRLSNAKEVDHELQQWLRSSYALAT
jgi:hypothetical protein